MTRIRCYSVNGKIRGNPGTLILDVLEVRTFLPDATRAMREMYLFIARLSDRRIEVRICIRLISFDVDARRTARSYVILIDLNSFLSPSVIVKKKKKKREERGKKKKEGGRGKGCPRGHAQC